VALLAGRMLREGVLQQSALSAVDAFCAPERTAALTDGILAAIAECEDMAARGVPAEEIEGRDFSLLLRAKERPAEPG
jgi:V/A-type H+-transporting ATPase subunit A